MDSTVECILDEMAKISAKMGTSPPTVATKESTNEAAAFAELEGMARLAVRVGVFREFYGLLRCKADISARKGGQGWAVGCGIQGEFHVGRKEECEGETAKRARMVSHKQIVPY